MFFRAIGIRVIFLRLLPLGKSIIVLRPRVLKTVLERFYFNLGILNLYSRGKSDVRYEPTSLYPALDPARILASILRILASILP